MRHDRNKFGGLAMMVGAFMFFAFWIGPATESDVSLIGFWQLQLLFHGVQIGLLVTGLLMTMRLPVEGWARYLWRTGAVLAAFGTPISLQVFALGVLLLGLGAAFTKGFRLASVALVPGAWLWLVLFIEGGIIGNESEPRLTVLEQALATSGVILISLGLVLLGGLILRGPTAVVGSTEEEPEHAGHEQ